ncbi:hypothetical protein H7K45_02540 [Mycobacterium yunnanensis]|uniref:Uncharacterized protein n=1 Tax=Mycobacterium yunnanensis TaxID=368477 RepID=A0A9X3BYV3_9MYCO|nr:DUF6611 family protein [Mycobacterium yunnanensis]MCV7419408.1 hypothetical protein [Mycobacterium yunnanensis]
MNDTTTTPRWRRLLDGGHSWGSLEVSPTRYGVTRYRLVVFPPGISADDRARLRIWRAWPTWGMATFLVLEILLVPAVGPVAALWISSIVFLGGGLAMMLTTAAYRGGVRTMIVIRRAGVHDPQAAERFVEFYVLAHELIEADRAFGAGETQPVGHELAVWRAYDRMAVRAPVATRR